MTLRSKKKKKGKKSSSSSSTSLIIREVYSKTTMGYFSPIRLAAVKGFNSAILTRSRGTKHINTCICVNQ